MAREQEKRVISLDPNIRPGFIKDKASHLARIRRMAAMSDIVKFSDEDLAWFGLEGDEDTLARHWLHHGAKLVVVTRGADGAVGYTANHKVTVPSEKVTVVDTVGAGDTFDAGVLASLKMQNLLTKAQVANLSEDQIAKRSPSAPRPLPSPYPAPAPTRPSQTKSASETSARLPVSAPPPVSAMAQAVEDDQGDDEQHGTRAAIDHIADAHLSAHGSSPSFVRKTSPVICSTKPNMSQTATGSATLIVSCTVQPTPAVATDGARHCR